MTPQARFRRIGWFAALAICTALYLVLQFKVSTVSSDVIKAERLIVTLEEKNMMLETEFMTRSSQIQLAAWNRVDFGYAAPRAEQFIDSERQLARFSGPRADNAPDPIRLANAVVEHETEPFPQLVSPLTGRPLDAALVEPEQASERHLALGIAPQTVRVALSAGHASRAGGQ